MKARVRAWMTGRPVLAFYVLAFAITWLAWSPAAAQSHGVPPFTSPSFTNPALFIVGGLGPGVAAVVVMRALHGEAGDQRLLAALWRWRVKIVWWVVAVFAPIAIWLAAAGLGGTLSSDLVRLAPWLALLPSLLWYLLQAVPEEVGWRGFALPRLQARYSALTASLIVGVLWALWHLPLLVDNRNVCRSTRWARGPSPPWPRQCCTRGCSTTPAAACSSSSSSTPCRTRSAGSRRIGPRMSCPTPWCRPCSRRSSWSCSGRRTCRVAASG